ncbi:hypothetical protein TNIN_237871 [Trichonephila inaurata madagascariensis]|uniref:Uncharacterized protein n=1 Tax=Trichonephila inaurata madagascariensis TaxID=2747483 RepID=A0A8X6Y907_9ARAC|nr:hypothetical protein TNIN_237871 [Trichonephila inaurata madagascariensis]
MDTLKTSLDDSDLFVQWSSKIRGVVENIEKCEILWRRLEKLFSLENSDFTYFATQDFWTEVSELEEMRADLHETGILMARFHKLIKSTRHVQDSTKNRLELIASLNISEEDRRSQAIVTNDLIELFETMVLLISSTINHVENVLTGIEHKMHLLTKIYSANDSHD